MASRRRDTPLSKAWHDTTPKPRKRTGRARSSPEGQAERIAKVLATANPKSTMALVEKANPNRPLTEKQKLFVSYWAQGETILSASVKAGYADGGTVAYRLAKDPAIRKIYDFEKAKYEEAAQMTRKDVMDMLKESYECAKMMSEPASMVSAAREIGKMCGYYEPVKRQLDINISGEVTVKKLERMSDAELLKLMKEDVTEVEFREVDEDEDDETSGTPRIAHDED